MAAQWFELSVEVPAKMGDAVGNFLIENGSPGLQIEDCGGRVRLKAYFAVEPPIERLHRFCDALPAAAPARHKRRIRVRRVAAENWAENWKAQFLPQSVGERLYVCPPWDVAPPPDRLAVIIDPGMAFGTGQHASTRGCLLLLEKAVRQGNVGRALDLGTGSGVLAIALAKLGVREIWAADTDADARAAAQSNADRNGIHGPIHVIAGFDELEGSVDLLVANLFANLLEGLTPRLVSRLNSHGLLICSGFLTTDEARLRTAYATQGMHLIDRYEEASWVTLAWQRSVLP